MKNNSEQKAFLKENWSSLEREEKAKLVREIVDSEVSRCSLAGFLGVHHSVVDRLYDQARRVETEQPTESESEQPQESTETNYKSDFMDISVKNTRIKTLEELIEQRQVDLSIWEVVEFTVKTWEGYAAEKSKSIHLTGKSGNDYIGWERGETKIIVEPLNAIRARFRKKTAVVDARNELERMKEEWKELAPVYVPMILPERKHDNMMEVVIPDIHVGKLAWAPEVGQDYDLKISEGLYDEAIEVAIERGKGFGLDKIVLVVGNDLLHFDNLENTTTRGTAVTADSRYQKVYKATRQMITRGIERLRKVTPVTVKVVPGNHDTVSSFTLGDALEVQFGNCPDVVIDNSPRYRKYLKFGKNMIMWTHGDKGKLDDYPLLMATEEPQMWGETVFREAHTGDKHQRRLIELHGVAVRILPTLCATDDWHSMMGFTSNLRCSENFIWNGEYGLIGTIIHNLPADKQQGLKAA